jgi:transposase
VLATAAWVACGRGLGASASHALGRAPRRWRDRLVACDRWQLARAGQRGGEQTGPSPVDRSRPGSKHHLICAGNGVPLAATLTAANRNDITELITLVDQVPRTGRHGKFRPKQLLADRAYDSNRHRQALRERGIRPRIAKRGSEHGSGLGTERWVVERTISWLHQQRRLDRRYERRADIHQAFLTLGCALICHQQLQRHQESFC